MDTVNNHSFNHKEQMSKTNKLTPTEESDLRYKIAELKQLITARNRCTKWKDLLITDGEPELLTATNEIYTRDSQDAHSTTVWMVQHGFAMAKMMGPNMTMEKPKAPQTAGGRASLMAYLHGMALGLEDLIDRSVLALQTHASELGDGKEGTVLQLLDRALTSRKNEADPTPTSDDVVP